MKLQFEIILYNIQNGKSRRLFLWYKPYFPTCGTAKFSSGMSVGEFMRGYSVINYPESALKANADYIIQLAESEGMKAHALAVKVRK